MAEKLAELCLCSSVFQKVVLGCTEIGYLTKERFLSKGVAWFLLSASSKVQEERKGLKIGPEL